MSKMIRRPSALAWLSPAVLALWAGPAATLAGPGTTLDVTYVANEGVLVEAGGQKVLVDALFRGSIDGYAKPAPDARERLETGAPPYDGVALILITHFHEDHFDPEAVVRRLRQDPGPLVLTTGQAAERLLRVAPELHDRVRILRPEAGKSVRVDHAGIRVEAFALHHGRDRPIENLGFRVTLGGARWLHVGDTQATADELRGVGLDGGSVDVAFLPTWLLVDEGWEDTPGLFRGAQVVAIHVPAPGAPADWFGDGGDLAALAGAIRRVFPGALVLSDPGERHRLTIPGRTPGD